MNVAFAMTATAMAFATSAFADSRIEALCGAGHANETAAVGDVVANPDGYYIRNLKTQISHGDARIVQFNEPGFHLCTTSAATPDMDQSRALSVMANRRVKYLFVPIDCPKQVPSS